MTQGAHLKIVRKTGSSTNRKHHAVRCEYIHSVVNHCQVTLYHTAGIRQELCDQFIAAHNEKPPWLTKAFVHTVWEIEHHDVVSFGIFADKFPGMNPGGWTKQASIMLAGATEAYIVEIIASSHCLKQQLISCRHSTYLLRWQGQEVMYSWNSLTCA